LVEREGCRREAAVRALHPDERQQACGEKR